MMRWGSVSSAGVDEAVLAELRAIRAEIHDLSERVAASATRDDLHNYVSAETFRAHIEEHRGRAQSWHAWAPLVISTAAFAWSVFWAVLGQHIVLR
jgi:hypothetical protein